MAIRCSHCGAIAPVDTDAYCGTCRESLDDVPHPVPPLKPAEVAGTKIPAPDAAPPSPPITEAEWLTKNDPDRMLTFLWRGRATDRQYRLFAAACARDELDLAHKTGNYYNFGKMADGPDYWETYWDPLRGYEAAIRTAEAWADGRVVDRTASSMWFVGWFKGIDDVSDIASAALGHDPDGLVLIPPEQIARTILGYQTNPAHFLRDIFGNPFRTVAFDPDWRTSTAVSIARGMYESRDFSPMPILSDALQDAGCENEDIVNHCRSGGPHVRGCWVVDLVFDKK